jgi:hypothetical protein
MDKVVLVPRLHPSFMHFEPDRRSPEPLLLQREKLGADADRLPVPLHFGQHPPKHLIGAAEHPHGRRTLSSLPACRSPAPAEPSGVPLRPQTCQLVEYGRDRNRRPARSMPGSAHQNHCDEVLAQLLIPPAHPRSGSAVCARGCRLRDRPHSKWLRPFQHSQARRGP